MAGDDEDELDTLEELTNGEDEEDEGDGEPTGEEGQEDEVEDETGPDEDESGQRPARVEVKSDVPSRQRRSQSRWQKREQELEATRRRAEEAEARANTLASQRQQEEARRQQALQADREQRRANMLPEERTAEDINELRAQISYQQQMDQFYRNDAEDRAQYEAKCSSNKVYKRHRTEVEKILKQARAGGMNLPREQILYNVVGREALGVSERNSSSQPTRRKSVSKPVNSRGDGASTPGKRGPSSDKEALRKRLENIPL